MQKGFKGVLEEMNTSIILLTETVMKQYEAIKRLEFKVTALEGVNTRRALAIVEDEVVMAVSLEEEYDSLG